MNTDKWFSFALSGGSETCVFVQGMKWKGTCCMLYLQPGRQLWPCEVERQREGGGGGGGGDWQRDGARATGKSRGAAGGSKKRTGTGRGKEKRLGLRRGSGKARGRGKATAGAPGTRSGLRNGTDGNGKTTGERSMIVYDNSIGECEDPYLLALAPR